MIFTRTKMRSGIIDILCVFQAFSVVCVLGNVCDDNLLPSNASYVTKNYMDENNAWINPGRGFYQKLITSSTPAYFDPIEASTLDCWRINEGISLLLRLYRLDSYVDGSPVSQEFLTKVQNDMITVHQAGWNVILRFMYNTDTNTIYNLTEEPPLPVILTHVSQLKPIFHEFEGIIVGVQAGFLGESGLWYEPGQSSDSSPSSYSFLLNALLNSVPKSIPIQVPRPEYKYEFLNQNKSTTVSDVYFGFSDKLRIGHFHECLLEGDANHLINAFVNLDTDIKAFEYLSNDTKFNLMGGRTCHPENIDTTKSLCTKSIALFENIHLSYLDIHEASEVIKFYKEHHCFNEIRQRLGYRLVLEQVILPTKAEAGGKMCVHVSINNKGFAAPYRNVDMSLIFKLNSSIIYHKGLYNNSGTDRLWSPSVPTINMFTKTISLPSRMQAGTYKVYLAISDPKWQNDSNYYILLGGVNKGRATAELSTGLNYLGDVEVLPSATNSHSSPLPLWNLPTSGNKIRFYIGLQGTQSCLKIPAGKPTPTGSTTPATTTPMTTTSTVTPTNHFTHYATCDKVEVTKALLQDAAFDSSIAFPCPDANPHSSEAILQRFCRAPSAAKWRPLDDGKVIDHCHEIPKFTPVAFFKSLFGISSYDRGLYGGMAGIFFGCDEANGVLQSIRIGIQFCGFNFDVTLIHPNEVDLQNLYVVKLI